jgi:hypothetical protein
MSDILALYDVVGIQRFLFRTAKLKDIIGASELVRGVLDAEKLNAAGIGRVVYTGGGSAVLRFDSEAAWKQFNRTFTRDLLLKAPGLAVLTVTDDSADIFPVRVQRLFRRMDSRKNRPGDSCPSHTLPPMAQAARDNEPVVLLDLSDNEDLSFSAHRKRATGDKISHEDMSYLLFDALARVDKSALPTVDAPLRRPPENLMAVVHIDGNQMGKIFAKVCRDFETEADMRLFSQTLDQCFKDAFAAMKDAITAKYTVFPVRLIYNNGDDLTYVCHSAYALASVACFTEKLYCLTRRTGQDGVLHILREISVSAGIAYVKLHYPFFDAYHIAERRCQQSKDKARGLAVGDSLDMGSWVNFEIVRGNGPGETLGVYFARPYCVKPPDGRTISPTANLHAVRALLYALSDKSFARSSLKALRNALFLGDVVSVLTNMRSKGQCLYGEYPLSSDAKDVFVLREGDLQPEKSHPLYDALDLMDLEVGLW